MARCPNCGNEVSDGAAFCGSCGSAMTAPQAMTGGAEATQEGGQAYGQGYSAGQGYQQSYQQQDQAFQPPSQPGQYGYGQPASNQFGYPPVAQPYPPVYGQGPVAVPKDKTVAILLAVGLGFLGLGFLAWLYTYQRDANKFWAGLGIAIGGPILGFFLILSLVGIFVGFILMFAPLAVWIWAVVDTASKSQDYYIRYPVG